MTTPTDPARRDAPGAVDAAHPSVGTLVKEASEHFSTLLRSELELAKSEVGREAKKAVAGSLFLIVAAVLVVLALPFVFVTLAEVLIAIGLPRWSGYAIIVGLFFVLAGLFGFLGIRKFKRVRAPERTVEALKRNAEIGRAFSSSSD